MELETLKDLYIHELKDLYSAENQLIKALPKMAKAATNPDLKGAPVDHTIAVREVRLSAGAEFVVAICGEIMTMPGLPKVPAADSIDVNAQGQIVGLF